eukprot:TRINITY_DN25701_c0_g3_i1.p1 TRINITY_DN25701_c0_g3~~TRINITY_DN25701_c0_g3_i1.p1  ORF type:complete len:262 (-),score=69.52 TRINITY_DN25701_c0_g3_i1:382-1077(-)
MAQPTSAWREYVESDPVYAFKGEVQEFPIMREDGTVDEERLEAYSRRLFALLKKPKQWVDMWHSMIIPVENQAEVLSVVLRVAREERAPQLGDILFELMKGMRVKVPNGGAAIKTAYKGAERTDHALARLFYLSYPKSPHSPWGWSRTGWGWQTWWQLLDSSLSVLEPTAAFDELAEVLELIQQGSEGVPLSSQELWKTQDRLKKARALLCKFGGLTDEADLLACTDATLS